MISIVLPTYNQAHFLGQALDSILDQTCLDYQLIIVNDGSRDNTLQLLEQYRARLSFLLVDQENQGLPRALNNGFKLATGEFFTWTSSDNIMLPEMLQVLSTALQEDSKISVAYSDWFFINASNSKRIAYHTIDYDRSLILRMNFVHCSFLFRREVFEKLGGYHPDLIYSEDWDFWIRASRYFRMKRVPRLLYLYRIHGGSMTAEILQGSAPSKVKYHEFDRRLRHQYPFDWYLGKIKLRWRRYLLRSDPRKSWQQAVQELSDA